MSNKLVKSNKGNSNSLTAGGVNDILRKLLNITGEKYTEKDYEEVVSEVISGFEKSKIVEIVLNTGEIMIFTLLSCGILGNVLTVGDQQVAEMRLALIGEMISEHFGFTFMTYKL